MAWAPNRSWCHVNELATLLEVVGFGAASLQCGQYSTVMFSLFTWQHAHSSWVRRTCLKPHLFEVTLPPACACIRAEPRRGVQKRSSLTASPHCTKSI